MVTIALVWLKAESQGTINGANWHRQEAGGPLNQLDLHLLDHFLRALHFMVHESC